MRYALIAIVLGAALALADDDVQLDEDDAVAAVEADVPEAPEGDEAR